MTSSTLPVTGTEGAGWVGAGVGAAAAGVAAGCPPGTVGFAFGAAVGGGWVARVPPRDGASPRVIPRGVGVPAGSGAGAEAGAGFVTGIGFSAGDQTCASVPV